MSKIFLFMYFFRFMYFFVLRFYYICIKKDYLFSEGTLELKIILD